MQKEIVNLKIDLMRVTKELNLANAKICELSELLYIKDMDKIKETDHDLDDETAHNALLGIPN